MSDHESAGEPFAPRWDLDGLVAEGLDALRGQPSADAQLIDGRALAVKLSPLRDNSRYLVMGTATLPPGFSTRAHSHLAEEVAIVLRGSGRIDIEGVDHPVHQGSVVVTPSDLVHVTHSDPGTEPLVILWFYAPPGSEARWVEPSLHATAGPAGREPEPSDAG